MLQNTTRQRVLAHQTQPVSFLHVVPEENIYTNQPREGRRCIIPQIVQQAEIDEESRKIPSRFTGYLVAQGPRSRINCIYKCFQQSSPCFNNVRGARWNTNHPPSLPRSAGLGHILLPQLHGHQNLMSAVEMMPLPRRLVRMAPAIRAGLL